MNWRVNAIAGPLDVAGPALHLAIVDAHLHERRGTSFPALLREPVIS
jgi:hypothetical protein